MRLVLREKKKLSESDDSRSSDFKKEIKPEDFLKLTLPLDAFNDIKRFVQSNDIDTISSMKNPAERSQYIKEKFNNNLVSSLIYNASGFVSPVENTVMGKLDIEGLSNKYIPSMSVNTEGKVTNHGGRSRTLAYLILKRNTPIKVIITVNHPTNTNVDKLPKTLTSQFSNETVTLGVDEDKPDVDSFITLVRKKVSNFSGITNVVLKNEINSKYDIKVNEIPVYVYSVPSVQKLPDGIEYPGLAEYGLFKKKEMDENVFGTNDVLKHDIRVFFDFAKVKIADKYKVQQGTVTHNIELKK